MRLAFLIGLVLPLHAHDAPASVTVHLHARPAGQTMRVLARVPLEAVRDVDFPKLADGYLDVAALAPRLPGLAKIWVADAVLFYENGRELAPPRIAAARVTLPSDRSFTSFALADALLRAPLPGNHESLVAKQLFFDVALEYAIADRRASFSVRPYLAGLGERVNTVFHYGDRTFLLPGDQEAFPVDPTWWQAGWRFVQLGFIHILEGTDHLLFLLCLVLACREWRGLLWLATAFTAAHSCTLAASALGWAPDSLWFPPLVEFLIALSIVVLALANLAGKGHTRWTLAFGFGLVHGFGFSFALREQLQFAGGHLAAALLAFNLGVEFGQLAALALMAPAVALLFRYATEERLGTIILSALVAHTGWHWMTERFALLSKYSFTLPSASSLALSLRGALGVMLVYALYQLARWRSLK
ncbi:MAG: HupE/UreJ family protein [Bryobacteraceae bacterium]|nr:HupE/UreJ family protein [Bryobacteraceae bacterium]